MGSLTVKMPDSFIEKVSRLGAKTDEIVPEVLKAGAEVLEEKVRDNLKGVIGKNTKRKSRSSGDLLAALGTTKPLLDRNGNYNVKIGFAENRRDGRINAVIANTLEYGKSGQSAKPFLKPAVKSSKNEVVAVMEAKLESEIDKL